MSWVGVAGCVPYGSVLFGVWGLGRAVLVGTIRRPARWRWMLKGHGRDPRVVGWWLGVLVGTEVVRWESTERSAGVGQRRAHSLAIFTLFGYASGVHRRRLRVLHPQPVCGVGSPRLQVFVRKPKRTKCLMWCNVLRSAYAILGAGAQVLPAIPSTGPASEQTAIVSPPCPPPSNPQP